MPPNSIYICILSDATNKRWTKLFCLNIYLHFPRLIEAIPCFDIFRFIKRSHKYPSLNGWGVLLRMSINLATMICHHACLKWQSDSKKCEHIIFVCTFCREYTLICGLEISWFTRLWSITIFSKMNMIFLPMTFPFNPLRSMVYRICILVNIGPYDGLTPHSTKPNPKTIQWAPCHSRESN